MSAVRSFLRFWYDFIVGDDWQVALGVGIALGVTAALEHSGIPAWWLVPICVAALLTRSVVRAARRGA